MATDDKTKLLRQCEECGAIVYPEHLQSAVAGFWKGKLLCKFCLAEHKEGTSAPAAEEPIHLPDTEKPRVVAAPSEKIRFGGSISQTSGDAERGLRRPLQRGTPFATRCKSFHGKLTDAAISYLNDQINEWVDAHEEVEIKFAQTTVGVVEGKHSEPHLIITVFY